MNPTDSTQQIAQLAQFSSLEQMLNVATEMGKLRTKNDQQAAVQLVGHGVTYKNASTGESIQGTVEKVTVGSNGPLLTIGGVGNIDPATITEVAVSAQVNPALVPPGPATGTPPVGAPGRVQRPGQQPSGPGFAQVLRETSAATAPARAAAGTGAPVTFSGHALQRLERRGITMDADTQRRLGEGVDRAASKGSRTAVVLIDQNAFVVGVPARTVVTAVGRDNMKEHVFTNIDSR